MYADTLLHAQVIEVDIMDSYIMHEYCAIHRKCIIVPDIYLSLPHFTVAGDYKCVNCKYVYTRSH